MKKKVLVLLAIVVLAVMICVPIVKATNLDDVVNNAVEFKNGKERSNPSKNTISSEVFESNEIVEKRNETVNGNVYLMGNDVKISNEIINGDTFIFANNVKLESDAIINGNVYICASNINVDSTITRGLYVAGKDIVLSENSSIQYDAYLCAEHLVISGSFDRNVNVAASKFEIKDSAIILENLNYTSDKEADIDKNAKITKINFDRKTIEKETVLDVIYNYVIDFTQYFVLTFILLIIMIKIMPNFIEKSKNCFGISSFGLGIATIILLPILLIALLVFPLTTTLAVVGIVTFIAMLIASMAISNIAIASAISAKHPKMKLPISTALTTIVAWIAYQIPVIGIIVAFFMIATGMGVVVKYTFTKSKEN